MRTLLILGLFFLASCGSQSGDTTLDFERNIPDTTKSWAGRMTKESYHEATRLVQVIQKLECGISLPLTTRKYFSFSKAIVLTGGVYVQFHFTKPKVTAYMLTIQE
jgi:hypothetical protein